MVGGNKQTHTHYAAHAHTHTHAHKHTHKRVGDKYPEVFTAPGDALMAGCVLLPAPARQGPPRKKQAL